VGNNLKIFGFEDIKSRPFIIDVDGFEGPLHLLLELARAQKVDLRRVSLLKLVEQYLNFISETRKLKIEIAADYLIMAAWLIFLKSRLLLPPDSSEDTLTAEELSENLKFQLRRLDAMRSSANKIMLRDRLGKEFFERGFKEKKIEKKEISHKSSLLELLQAYASLKTKAIFEPLHLRNVKIFTPESALGQVKRMLSKLLGWERMMNLIPPAWSEKPALRRSATATTFAVSLELARTGVVELRQEEIFAPIFIRKRKQELKQD